MGLITEKIVDNETPGGSINGVNKVFTLSNTPNPAVSLELFLNGVFRAVNLDYTLSNGTITFITAPLNNSVLRACYRYLA